MRKFVIFLSIFVILIIPFNVNAVSVKDVSITGNNSQKIGHEITLKFRINFDDLPSGFDQTRGIWLVTYNLAFDSNVLLPSNISSPYFTSKLYELDNEYYIISEVNDNDNDNIMCANGGLYCSDYELSLSFYIKDTDKKATTVSISDVSIGLLDIDDYEKEYTLQDIIELNSPITKTHNINIETATITSNTAPTMVVPRVSSKSNVIKNNKVSQTTKKTSNSNNKTSNTKSTNNYLKSLEIKDHEIDFNKYSNEYEVNISNKVNSLDIKVSLEDKKAKYKVIGANDLKSNNYKVNIEVTSADGKKNIYTIKAKVKEVEEVITNEEKTKEPIDKRFLIYGGIGLGIFLLIVIIIFIINKIKDCKINKLLDEL